MILPYPSTYLPVQTMSRPQAAFQLENGKLFLRDLESSNGTFVNNVRLSNEMEVNCQDILGYRVCC